MPDARSVPLFRWGEDLRRNRRARRTTRLHLLTAAAAAATATAIIGSLFWAPLLLVWNASASSPIGLYAVSGAEHLRPGETVVAWPPAADALTIETAGEYQFFGGGAGDNASFERTTVFCGTQVFSDAAVGLEILSRKPLGIGVSHGWEPASEPFRVTEAAGLKLISLNGLPAVEAFEEHAQAKGEQIDRAAPIPFFLQNIIGIDTGSGYRLRVPLAVNEDGSVQCAAEIPNGSIVRIMKSSHASAAEAAERATDAAIAAIGPNRPKAALFFDCVATRLRCGDHFEAEVDAVTSRIGDAALAGCNTHGQIARAEGQFEGFHNCTAVVCVFPD